MFSGTVMWFDPERGVGGIAVDRSEIDGGRQILCPRDRVRLAVRNGSLGALAARMWTP